MNKRSFSERLMNMSDEVWERHANPLSGWSRMGILPLFALAVWSRVWLGWLCLVPLFLVIFWTWWNPRAFGPPTHLDHWVSKGVMGERVWIARHEAPVPHYHHRMPHYLVVGSAIGLLPLAWGLWQLEIWPTITGMILIIGGKLWFLDRMVWLLADHEKADADSSDE